DEMPTASAKSKPKRRWFQFSLRSLAVVIFVLSVGLAWLASERQKVTARRQAIAAITTLGGHVSFDESQSFRPAWTHPLLGDDTAGEVQKVYLDYKPISDADLAHLSRLTKVAAL